MRYLTFLCLFMLSNVAFAQSFGSYIGKVIAVWNIDGQTMTLTEPFAYLDPKGLRWDAPKGSTVDGASIPQFAWSIIGGPFEGKYRDSSVIHDVACVEKRRPWEQVHETFYSGMLASGVSAIKAKIMYAAVYHFGPRWPKKEIIHTVTSQTTEKHSCISVSFGPPICITFPATQQPVETEIAMDIPPAPATLTREEFDRLSLEIERKESTEQPVSLEQIRDYK